MAHFYGSMTGSRNTAATKTGTKKSGIQAPGGGPCGGLDDRGAVYRRLPGF